LLLLLGCRLGLLLLLLALLLLLRDRSNLG
jgi:hypothetical protein